VEQNPIPAVAGINFRVLHLPTNEDCVENQLPE